MTIRRRNESLDDWLKRSEEEAYENWQKYEERVKAAWGILPSAMDAYLELEDQFGEYEARRIHNYIEAYIEARINKETPQCFTT